MTVALDVHSASAKDAMHSLAVVGESRIKEVSGRVHGTPGSPEDKNEDPKYQQVQESSEATVEEVFRLNVV